MVSKKAIAGGALVAGVGTAAALVFLKPWENGSGTPPPPPPGTLVLALEANNLAPPIGQEVTFTVTAVKDGVPQSGVGIYAFDNGTNLSPSQPAAMTNVEGKATSKLSFTTTVTHSVYVSDRVNGQ